MPATEVTEICKPSIKYFKAAEDLYDEEQGPQLLPKKFNLAAKQLRLVLKALDQIQVKAKKTNESQWTEIKSVLKQCCIDAERTKATFEDVLSFHGNMTRQQRFLKIVAKSSEIAGCIERTLGGLESVSNAAVLSEDNEVFQEIRRALNELQNTPPDDQKDNDQGTGKRGPRPGKRLPHKEGPGFYNGNIGPAPPIGAINWANGRVPKKDLK